MRVTSLSPGVSRRRGTESRTITRRAKLAADREADRKRYQGRARYTKWMRGSTNGGQLTIQYGGKRLGRPSRS
jgi:hypothetical protein